jgi:hypothetical protein
MSRTVDLAGFAVIAACVVGLHVAGLLRHDQPHAGDVFGCVMRTHLGRWLVVLGWWWLGWHFFAR